MKILWLTNIPSPYRVDFFEELGKQNNLTVLFERGYSSERNDSWKQLNFKNFRADFLKGFNYSVDQSFSINIQKFLNKNKYDVIVISNPLTPTGILATFILKIKKIDYFIETDGGFIKKDNLFKKIIKRFVYSNALYCLSTGEMHSKYYKYYGVKAEKILKYPFSSIKNDNIIKSPTMLQDKKKLKNSININEENVIISVGQFIHRKGFDILIKTASLCEDNTRFFIIGGKKTKEYDELIKLYDVKNVTFIDFLTPDKLEEYYKVADIFVFPTREDIWGLVINEAIAYGLPVITTNKCLAGVEIINSEHNGFVIDLDDEKDIELKIAEKIHFLLNNKNKIYEINEKNVKLAETYTIENMAYVHNKIFKGFI